VDRRGKRQSRSLRRKKEKMGTGEMCALVDAFQGLLILLSSWYNRKEGGDNPAREV